MKSTSPPASTFCTRLHRRVLVALLFGATWCAGSVPYQPEPGDPLLEPWRLRTFPQLSGLGAECMAEGSDGTLWFGTAETVWSYDGFEWSEHPIQLIAGGSPKTFCPGPDRSLYAGGSWGIIVLRDGEWTRFFPSERRGFADIRKLIMGRDGSLWAATDYGALRHHEQRWTLFTDAASAAARQSVADQMKVDLQIFPAHVSNAPLTSTRQNRSVDLVDIAEDRDGRIWIGTSGGEVLCFTPGPAASAPGTDQPPGTWTVFSEMDGLARGENPSLLPLREGPVWVVYGSGSTHASIYEGGAWRTTDNGHPVQTDTSPG